MLEARDSAIKLFGMTIPLQPNVQPPPPASGGAGRGGEDEKETGSNGAASPASSSAGEEEPPTKNPAPESQSGSAAATNSKENPPKKPDKILPCPRCTSMDTKFCYFNNYNVNQPRHFCKNCQRYWTAGGTTRNVPVGAGRRKNKGSVSQHRLVTVPESCPPPVRSNAGSTVLSFGSSTEEGRQDVMGGRGLHGSHLWQYPWNPITTLYTPSFAVPVHWGCMVPGTWSTPWPPSPSLSLGKHSRDGDSGKEGAQDGCIWVPKTLRIDNIDEAAKSSIWSALGIKMFEPKGDGIKGSTLESSRLLHANPAALSRSVGFHESS